MKKKTCWKIFPKPCNHFNSEPVGLEEEEEEEEKPLTSCQGYRVPIPSHPKKAWHIKLLKVIIIFKSHCL